MRIPPSVRFAALLFLPVLVPLLFPVPCLGTNCVLLTLIQIADPSSLEPAGLAGFCSWALGPIPGAVGIIVVGLLCYRLVQTQRVSRIGWGIVWVVFTLAAFLVAWYGITMVTSIGASETPPEVFLTVTAGMSLVVITLGQPVILLWLSMVNRYGKKHQPGQLPPG